MNNRDRQIVEHILRYCREAMDTVKRFDASKEKFKSDHVFYNACSMAVFQIGELSKRISDTFKETHAELPWSEMRGMRNLFAHEYESVDKDLLWETVTNDIPALHIRLQKIYQSNDTTEDSSDNEKGRPH